MESQQTVMIPNEALFSSDGQNFMVSLPIEAADGSGVINVPILFTTEGSSVSELVENQSVSETIVTDLASGDAPNSPSFVLKNISAGSKNSFFLDASQFALLSGGDHLILTTTGNPEEGEEGSATDAEPGEQLLFTSAQNTDARDSDTAARTTYITSVLPNSQNQNSVIDKPLPRNGVLNSIAEEMECENLTITAPKTQTRKPGRPRKVLDDVQPPINKGPYNCDLCSQKFLSWVQFRRHKLEHREDKPNRCSHCPLSFNLQSNLALHASTHAKGPPWTCAECFRSFTRLASLKAHTMVHEREENLFCEHCGEECISQVQLDRHVKQEHGTEGGNQVKHHCRHCSRDFPNKLQLKVHLMEHAKRTASLKISQHRKAHKTKRLARSSHVCRVCSRGFSKLSQLQRHLRIHSGEKPFVCEECGYRFTQKGSLQIHMLKHRGCRPYCCNFCPATFTQRGNLRSHISRVHILPRPGQQVYQCQQCTCVFRKVGSLNAHVSRLHSSTTTRILPAENASIAILEGVSPDASSATQMPTSTTEANVLKSGDNSDILQQAIHKSGLQQPGTREEDNITEVQLADSQGDGTTRRFIVRMRRHVGVRWHQCIYCIKEFKKPSDLIRHMRTHTNEKPFTCEVCRRTFAVKSTLNAHMHTHTQERSHTCDVCHKRYASASSLGVHTRLHLGIKPFPCDTCGRRFRTTGNRTAHQCESARKERSEKRKQQIAERREMREQIRNGSFPFLQDPLYVSESGGITVVTKKKGALPDESEIGQIMRPFVCAECGCRFKKSSHLKQHEISHKGIKSFMCNICGKNFVSPGVMRAHRQTHEKSHKFKCDSCGQLYTTKGSLKRHLASHSAQKPYVCPYCHRNFKTSSNCRKHIRVHAKEVLSHIMEPSNESTSEVIRQMESELPSLAVPQEAHNISVTPSVPVNQPSLQSEKSILQNPDQQTSKNIDTVVTTVADMKKPTTGTLRILSEDKLDSTIDQQILNPSQTSTSHVIDHNQHHSQPNALLGDTVISSATQTSQLPISLQDQSILTLGQTTSSDLKTAVEFPTLLSDQSGVLGGGPSGGLVTVEGVYIQGFDGQALDTTLFSGGIPIQTDPIEMGVLTNILASTSHGDTNTEDEPSRFSCERCKEGFASLEILRQHASEEHTYSCPLCSEHFDSQTLLEHHMTSHMKQQKIVKRKNECQICNLIFRTPRQLSVHKSRAHRNIHGSASLVPDGPLPSLTTTLEPTNSRRKGIKATQVSEQEVSKALQLEGVQEPSLSERVFLASVQEKERLSSSAKEASDTSLVVPKYANACTICPKSFKKPSDMVRHMRIHTGERPFVCSQCGKGFTVKSTLVAHFSTHRKDAVSGIPCHICGSTFATKGSLRVHMRIHTGVKPLKCPHCDQCFRTSGHRKAHVLSAHRVEQPDHLTTKSIMESNLESEIDDTDTEANVIETLQSETDMPPETAEAETTPENLQLLPIHLESTELIQLDENLLQQLQAGNFILHSADSEGTIRFEVFSNVTGQQVIGEISTDTSNVDKSSEVNTEVLASSKQCATCGKTFSKPSQLLRHIRIHTGDKPFPCMICPKRFNQKNALNTHLLMHTGQKPYQCMHCSKFFSQSGNLKTHVRRAHPETQQSTSTKK